MSRIQRILTILLVVVMVVPMSVFHIDAAAGTKYENEPSNDDASGATLTYDDYDNYGTIDAADDADWWKISFSSAGMANFWLGQIPSGCDYDLYLYKSDHFTEIAQSTRTSNSAEQIRCHVKANTVYYLVIISKNGVSSTSQYKLRIKNYVNRLSAIVSIDPDLVSGSGVHSTIYDYCNPRLTGLGFTSEDVLNNTASSVYNILPNRDIVVIYGDGCSSGRFPLANSTNLVGLSYSGMPSTDRALSTYTGNALSETELIIFAGQNTGDNSSTYGSLVNQAWTEGAYGAIGWKSTPSLDLFIYWTDQFFYNCNGKHVRHAIMMANVNIEAYVMYEEDLYQITQQYWGNSKLSTLFLDRYY